MKDQPLASYAARVELAKTIGTVRPDKGRYMIDICVDGERYRLRHTPVVGGGWLRIRDAESATEVLGFIRSAIATGSSVEQAIAPYLKGGGDKFKVRAAYGRLLDQKQKEADAQADLDQRAEGGGQLSLRKARLARLPVLSTIDEALDRVAEAAMKREHQGHDALSLEFSFDGGRARIEKLRMNSRWYGLRGHGDVFLDSRLDLEVDGGVVARVENEMGELGEVLGEITQTLLRAHVTGTLSEPEVGIEILRQPVSK